MDFLNHKSKILITCSLHSAGILANEVKSLGFMVKNAARSSVEISGTLSDCLRLNFHLRTAWRVLYRIASFPCHTPKEFYSKLKSALSWENILRQNSFFSIHSAVTNRSVTNSMYANQVAKDAIADYFNAKFGARPSSGKEKSKAVFFLYWNQNEVEFYIDTSGESLDKRGYRLHPFEAPMQETLAAACILSTRWNRLDPLIHPMCGSGTIAIEAALMLKNIPPGLLRSNYGFMHINGYEERFYLNEVRTAKKNIRPEIQTKIIASDISKMAINASFQNAENAGVSDAVEFSVCEFQETLIPPGSGIIFLNPPYGERMGELTELEKLYGAIGNFFKQKCTGKTGYVFTGNFHLAGKIGLKPAKRMEFVHAKIDCRFLEFEIYEGSRRTENY